MEQVGKTESFKKATVNCKAVNSEEGFISTVNSEESSKAKKIKDFIVDLGYSEADVAQTLADGLDDQKSLKFYQILCQKYPHERLLEALHCVSQAKGVRFKPGYFMAILRRWGYQLKFRSKK